MLQHNKKREELQRLQEKYPEQAAKLSRVRLGWWCLDSRDQGCVRRADGAPYYYYILLLFIYYYLVIT